METEKVVLFLDYANINKTARGKRFRLDLYDLLCYVGDGRFLIDAYCYMPINPRNEHRLDREIEEFWRAGYIVNAKLGSITGGTYRCKFDVEITMDVLKVIHQVKPDIIVLATGDADFISLVQEVRKSGVRIEVAAFEETIDPEILLKCSGFINLTEYYEGYLAAQNGEQSKEISAESYKDLIQSQENDLREAHEEEAKLIVDPLDKEIDIPLPDNADISDNADSFDALENVDELHV